MPGRTGSVNPQTDDACCRRNPVKISKPRDYVVHNLRYAFNPSSIAVVGVSNNPAKVGFQVIHGLLRYRTPAGSIP